MERLKAAVRWLMDGVSRAVWWGLLTLVFYALFFMDLTGRGSGWNALRGAAHEVLPVARPLVPRGEARSGLPRAVADGEARVFVVYGEIEPAPRARAAAVSPGSAYRAGSAAAVRPGIGPRPARLTPASPVSRSGM